MSFGPKTQVIAFPRLYSIEWKSACRRQVGVGGTYEYASGPFREIPGDLAHPQSVRELRDSRDLNLPRRQLDEEEKHGLVLDPDPADPNDAGAKAYNEVIAHHPRLESLILPIVRTRVDGLSISLVR
jgi:hypothetical protein